MARKAKSTKNLAHNTPSAETIETERQALELRRAGASYDEISARVGYAHRSSARRAVERALARTLQAPAAELRDLENDRLDRLQMALWPKAMRGQERSVEMVLRVMERRARLNGLDHADGLAERAQHLDELHAALVVQAIGGILSDLELTPEQQERVATVVPARMRAITDADVVDGALADPEAGDL